MHRYTLEGFGKLWAIPNNYVKGCIALFRGIEISYQEYLCGGLFLFQGLVGGDGFAETTEHVV